MRKTTRSIAATILFLLLTLAVAFPAAAAAAPKLSKTKITVAAGRTYQLKVKNLKKKTPSSLMLATSVLSTRSFVGLWKWIISHLSAQLATVKAEQATDL